MRATCQEPGREAPDPVARRRRGLAHGRQVANFMRRQAPCAGVDVVAQRHVAHVPDVQWHMLFCKLIWDVCLVLSEGTPHTA